MINKIVQWNLSYLNLNLLRQRVVHKSEKSTSLKLYIDNLNDLVIQIF